MSGALLLERHPAPRSAIHPSLSDIAQLIPPPPSDVRAYARWLKRVALVDESGEVTAEGLYGLTFEKWFINTAGESAEDEDNKELMVTDSEVPDFTVHDFRADITAEVAGAGYAAGGVAVTTTEITLAAGLLTFDADNTVYPTVTIVDAMAGVGFNNVGAAGTDQLVFLQDFVTAASSTAANFTIQHAGGGIWTLDYTP